MHVHPNPNVPPKVVTELMDGPSNILNFINGSNPFGISIAVRKEIDDGLALLKNTMEFADTVNGNNPSKNAASDILGVDGVYIYTDTVFSPEALISIERTIFTVQPKRVIDEGSCLHNLRRFIELGIKNHQMMSIQKNAMPKSKQAYVTLNALPKYMSFVLYRPAPEGKSPLHLPIPTAPQVCEDEMPYRRSYVKVMVYRLLQTVADFVMTPEGTLRILFSEDILISQTSPATILPNFNVLLEHQMIYNTGVDSFHPFLLYTMDPKLSENMPLYLIRAINLWPVLMMARTLLFLTSDAPMMTMEKRKATFGDPQIATLLREEYNSKEFPYEFQQVLKSHLGPMRTKGMVTQLVIDALVEVCTNPTEKNVEVFIAILKDALIRLRSYVYDIELHVKLFGKDCRTLSEKFLAVDEF